MIKFALILLPILVSCNSKEFKVGECIQKPDEAIVWKVDTVKKDTLIITQKQNPSLPQRKEVTPSSDWIISSCSN